jgi:hypothetical protein
MDRQTDHSIPQPARPVEAGRREGGMGYRPDIHRHDASAGQSLEDVLFALGVERDQERTRAGREISEERVTAPLSSWRRNR